MAPLALHRLYRRNHQFCDSIEHFARDTSPVECHVTEECCHQSQAWLKRYRLPAIHPLQQRGNHITLGEATLERREGSPSAGRWRSWEQVMRIDASGILVVTLLALSSGAQADSKEAAPTAQEPMAGQQGHTPSTDKSAPEASKPRPAVQVTVGGQKTSVTNGPVWFEWTGSEAMTRLGGHAVRQSGLQAASSAAEAPVKVTVSGELTLMGGPKFHRGARAPLAAVFERAVKLDGSRAFDELDAKRLTLDAAVAAGIAQSPVSLALKGLAVGDVVLSLLQSTGVGGWFNTKLVGDPRGICLSRCETWNHVKQTAYVRVQIQQGSQPSQEVRIMAIANGETLVIDEVVQRAVDAVWALFTSAAAVPAQAAAAGSAAAPGN